MKKIGDRSPQSLFIYSLISLFTLMGCNRPEGGGSSLLKIRIPSAAEFKSSGGAPKNSTKANEKGVQGLALTTPIEYANLCFGVNVKGGKIKSNPLLACEVEKGATAGSVPPGQEISLELLSNQNVTFELYGFLRTNSTDPCPLMTEGVWSWPIDKTYLLSSKNEVSIVAPETQVELTVSLPTSDQNIAIQNSWAQSCLAVEPVTPNGVVPGRVVSGASVLVGGNHRLYLRSSSQNELKPLNGSGYKIKSWRTQ